ncbi:MAG: DUF4124 domain-containing protein [Halioglobus sp.]|nr:DUF4124 domain-containing protein [Halioglobus sp.]
MKGIGIYRFIAAGLFGLALQGTASAQIYERTDAEGVPEFSDSPTQGDEDTTTQGAEVVDLPQTNVMDAPPEEPAEAQASQQQQEQGQQESGQDTAGDDGEQGEGVDGDMYYGDDADDVRAQRRIDEDRVDNALPGDPARGVGAPGVGVGAPGPGVEPRPAEEGGEPAEVRHAEGGRR